MNDNLNLFEKITIQTLKINLKYNTSLGGIVINNNQIEIVDRKKFKYFSLLIGILLLVSILGVVFAIIAPFL